jgi:serpin B
MKQYSDFVTAGETKGFRHPDSMNTSTTAINTLGLELLARAGNPDENALLSPYSIQCALAMAYAGADGTTKTEMARVLHYPPDETELHVSLAALQKSLEETMKESAAVAGRMQQYARYDPITLAVANRLFGQQGYDFRDEFLSLVKENYRAPFQALDFVRDPTSARRTINRWVEEQTQKRIQDLLPEGALNTLTRLVLVNAIYLKAPWNNPFMVQSTKPLPFHLSGGRDVKVPTMFARERFGYAKRPGMTVLALPYTNEDLHCIIFLPEANTGLLDFERRLNSDALAENRKLPEREVLLYLPKFKMEPPMLELGGMLRGLGMKTAFDEPRGSANFERMAPCRLDAYLYLSEVFHKCFLSLDENGTEAAAATALNMMFGHAALEQPKPIEVHVDHPFIFAIQHAPSGACLILGRVADPR